MTFRPFLATVALGLFPLAIAEPAVPVCGGCPTTAKCPQDGGVADYDDSYEQNGTVYCVYVHHVQTRNGPQDHRFKVVCR